MLAHDFRSPLAIALGALRELQDAGAGHALDEDDAALIANGVRSCLRLDDLIASYLETMRLEEDAIAVKLEPVDANALVRALTEEHSASFRRKGVALTVSSAADVLALADEGLMRRAAANLLSNALKFTRAGGSVRLSAAVRDGRAVITVSDDGPGIPAADLPRIFDRFYQGDHGRGQGGLGLGLTFCRAAMRAMHGEVGVESAPGRGSQFALSVPLAAPEARP